MRKYEIVIDKKVYNVTVNEFTQESAELEINGHPYALKFKGPLHTIMDGGIAGPAAQIESAVQPVQPQIQPSIPPATQPAASPQVSDGQSGIAAPIPGSIINILVKVGDHIEAGQLVIKMEAMKMENEINAQKSGTVKSINVSVGDAVSQGDLLIVVE